ncbi:MAG: hypothetical protein KGM99_11095, partial [Burkholderiales bacterium]|nr:hypothetical protein [Burkholderiales bacterium]
MRQLAHPSFNLPKAVVLLFLTLCTLLTVPAQASGWQIDFPKLKEAVGSGEFRWFGISVYSAKLWSEQRTFDANTSFALELTYHRAISRERLVQTSLEEIKHLFGKNMPSEKLLRWEADMSHTFRNVNQNEKLIGVFIPQYGCRFYSQKEQL